MIMMSSSVSYAKERKKERLFLYSKPFIVGVSEK